MQTRASGPGSSSGGTAGCRLRDRATIRLAERCGLSALLAEKVKLTAAGRGSRMAGPISWAKYALEVPVDGGGPTLMITGVIREFAA